MIEIDIFKIVIDVLVSLPLLMSLVLYIDYKINGDYDIEFKMFEFEDAFNQNDLVIRLIKKVNEVINNNSCDMFNTGLCDYYWTKYKEDCRYRQSHNIICQKVNIQNE